MAGDFVTQLLECRGDLRIAPNGDRDRENRQRQLATLKNA
jgi:hypothetical protein